MDQLLKSVLSLKMVNKQLDVQISALSLGYASQSQYEIPYTQPIFSGLDETSHFSSLPIPCTGIVVYYIVEYFC